MPPKRIAERRAWDGSLTEGRGTMRMASGAYEGPYSFESRFEEGDGTNPEELIAAAHAGCFSMALLRRSVGEAGHEVESVDRLERRVHLERGRATGFRSKRIELRSRKLRPASDDSDFQRAWGRAGPCRTWPGARCQTGRGTQKRF